MGLSSIKPRNESIDIIKKHLDDEALSKFATLAEKPGACEKFKKSYTMLKSFM